jgi:hypothetical protein
VYISRFRVLCGEDLAGTSEDSRLRIPPTAYETGKVKYEEGVEGWLRFLGDEFVESRVGEVGEADMVAFISQDSNGAMVNQGM